MKITRLKINNFRQFTQKELEFKNDWIIIVAPNARGKSTIIEAIHMLAHGRSPWTSTNSEIIRWDKESSEDKKSQTSSNSYQTLVSNNCRIEAQISHNKESLTAALYLETLENSTRKQYQINGSSTTRNKFTQKIHSILFSPDLIDLLMFRPQERRSYLDESISQIDFDYSSILTNYNKVLRQRNSLLKLIRSAKFKNRNTEHFEKNLKFWSEKLVVSGSELISRRIQFIEQVNQTETQLYQSQIEYLPKIEISEMENLAESDYIAKLFKSQLTKKESEDIMRGVTTIGPHRDDWYLLNKSKNINTFGSRGEKRMAIADIIFKLNSILEDSIKIKPIILLDDVASELDPFNISILFNKKVSQNQQVVITTTDINTIPEGAKKISQIIEI